MKYYVSKQQNFNHPSVLYGNMIKRHLAFQPLRDQQRALYYWCIPRFASAEVPCDAFLSWSDDYILKYGIRIPRYYDAGGLDLVTSSLNKKFIMVYAYSSWSLSELATTNMSIALVFTNRLPLPMYKSTTCTDVLQGSWITF